MTRFRKIAVLTGGLSAEREVSLSSGRGVVKFIVVDRHQATGAHLMETPDVIKPVHRGSPVGISIIRKGDNRPPAELGNESWNLSNEMMVEEFVPGRELTVSVMGDCALDVTEITTDLESHDHDAKCAPGGSGHILPAFLPQKAAEQAMELAIAAHRALGCRGVTRTDFRYDDTGANHRMILLDTDNQPGMTPVSRVPEQAAHIGMSYAKLCRWIVEDASCDR